jgi:hypothetical protein
MLSVDFNQLPQLTKGRFVAATGNPAVRIAFEASASASAWQGGCLLTVAGVPLVLILATLLTMNVDNWNSGWNPATALFALLALFAVLGGLSVARSRVVRKAYPYALGTYVFPTQIVVAESQILVLRPLSELINIATVDHYVTRVTDRSYSRSITTCTFKTGPDIVLLFVNIQEAHRVRDALSQGRQTLLTALARRDYEPLRMLDPLFEAQMTSFAKVSEPGPMAQALPKWTDGGLRFLIALGSSVVLTGLVVLVRVIIVAVSP